MKDVISVVETGKIGIFCIPIICIYIWLIFRRVWMEFQWTVNRMLFDG